MRTPSSLTLLPPVTSRFYCLLIWFLFLTSADGFVPCQSSRVHNYLAFRNIKNESDQSRNHRSRTALSAALGRYHRGQDGNIEHRSKCESAIEAVDVCQIFVSENSESENEQATWNTKQQFDDGSKRNNLNLIRSTVQSMLHSLDKANEGPLDASARRARITTPLSAAASALVASSGSFSSLLTATPAYAADNDSKSTAMNSYADSVNAYFKSAAPVSSLSNRIVSILSSRGFDTSEKGISILSSLCSDENNDAPNTILGNIRRQLNAKESNVVKLGALAGLPLYAASDLNMVFGDVAKGIGPNKILVVFGPHIGIGSDGIVGKKGTGACGTALGAYGVVLERREAERLKAERKSSGGSANPSGSGAGGSSSAKESFDVLSLVSTPGPQRDSLKEVQEEYLVDQLYNRLTKNDLSNSDQNAVVKKVMETTYGLIHELLTKEIDLAIRRSNLWSREGVEIVLLGGIVVRGTGNGGTEDLFQPLQLSSLKAEGKTEDLLPRLLDGKDFAKEIPQQQQQVSQQQTPASEEELKIREERAKLQQAQAEEEARRKAADEQARADLKAAEEAAERQRVAREKELEVQRKAVEERAQAEQRAAQEAERQRIVRENEAEAVRTRLAAEKEAENRRAATQAKANEGIMKKSEAENFLKEARKSQIVSTSPPPTPSPVTASKSVQKNTDVAPISDTSNNSEGGINSFLTSLASTAIGGLAAAAVIARLDDGPAKPPSPKASAGKGPPPKPTPPKIQMPSFTKKSPELTQKSGDDSVFSSSSRYKTGFPESYIDKIDEACDADDQKSIIEDCAPAVKEYFDSVSKGEQEPTENDSKVIGSKLDALSDKNQPTKARVISPARSGPAVESYLSQLAKGEVESPSNSEVESMLDSISSGEVDAPKTVEEINALMYSIIETMRPPKIMEQVCDPDEAETKEYLDAIGADGRASGAIDKETPAEAIKPPGNYLDALSFASDDTKTDPGKSRTLPRSTSGFSYLDSLTSTGNEAQEDNSQDREGFDAYEIDIGEDAEYNEDFPSEFRSSPKLPPRSYATIICDECDTEEASECCVAAISSYLDALALGATEQNDEANEAIVSYFEKITGWDCKNAVLHYMDEVAATAKAPSTISLLRYLESLADGSMLPPSKTRPITLYIENKEDEE